MRERGSVAEYEGRWEDRRERRRRESVSCESYEVREVAYQAKRSTTPMGVFEKTTEER